MLQQCSRQLLVVAFAISVFTATSVAPVAAADGVDLGGDDGISIGTDGIGVGGDSGVQVGADTEDGINASVAGEDGVEVGASPDDGVEAGVADEDVSVGPDGVEGPGDVGGGGVGDIGGDSVGDVGGDGVGDIGGDGVGDVGGDGVGGVGGAVPTDGGLDSVSSSVGDLGSGNTGVDSVGSGVGSVGDTGDLDVPAEPTDLEASTDDLPADARPLTQILQSVPTTNQTDPANFPVGDERAQVNVCDPLDVQADDLPADSVPGPDDLPSELSPPGVPTDIVTTEAVLGIILGFVPGPCKVVNPNEPQVDPTNLPDEPDGSLNVARFGQYGDGGVGLIYYDGTLNESGDGPSISGKSGSLATTDGGDIDQELVIDDGRNEYGARPFFKYTDDGFQGEAVLVLMGKNAGIGGACSDLQEFNGDLSVDDLEENPLGPCEYKLVGLPNLFGPKDLVGILSGLGDTGDEPPVNVDALPVNPDALLNL